MKQTIFLIVNSQSGECRLRKTPSAGPMEYVFQVNLETPDTPIPVVTINIPVPLAPAVVTEVKEIPFGVPWAISEGLIEAKGLSPRGEIILDYTNKGLQRLYQEAGGEERGLELYHLHEYAKKNWGLPFIYIEPDRWDKLLGKKEVEGG
ncbi:unnamed protein product [marine sediment metagenome]|uniref:Uncharacterized protein n=1 Tax=marine sediment metagenome TaxID=412755 RepID=X1KGT6_9ZZZZ